jgi:ABC-type amino acid transport system permease subunit
MTEEMNNNEVQNTSNDPGVQISVEQILASILSLGPVSVPLDNLIANYGGKNIAVNQDPDTKVVTFDLADVVLSEDSSAETENNPAE